MDKEPHIFVILHTDSHKQRKEKLCVCAYIHTCLTVSKVSSKSPLPVQTGVHGESRCGGGCDLHHHITQIHTQSHTHKTQLLSTRSLFSPHLNVQHGPEKSLFPGILAFSVTHVYSVLLVLVSADKVHL